MDIIRIEKLSLKYGKQHIFDTISFSFEKGKIIGLIGPNGAGKSSIIKILAGLVAPEYGELYINEIKQSSFSELRSYCGYLIDSPSFYPYLSAKQNLKLISKLGKGSTNLDKLLYKVGLFDVGNKKVKHFSTGMKQRLAIALALLRSPEILILDEPFNGLDPNGFQEVVDLLKKLNQQGVTIIISSHLLNDLEQFSDAFLLLHNGEIALNITKRNLMQAERKVVLTFENPPNEKANDYIKEMSGFFENSTKVVLHLRSSEIADVVNYFVKIRQTPINIETLTVLQEKFMEITL